MTAAQLMDTADTLRSRSAPRRFDRFELYPAERLLLADGVPVPLGARAFDLLVQLSDSPGTLILKDDLLASVWQGLVVEENNLQVQVSTLRKILGPGALATIPGRGYRFNLPVVVEDASALRQDAAQPGLATRGDDAETIASARTNLPSRLPSLYGRDEDVDAIVALVREHAVVTITGSGGIGKTRVAQAVAARLVTEAATDYPDGVWWIELAALTDGALVPSAMAQAMGMRIEGERATALALRSQLAGRRALLVLDNCEHLTDDVATVIETVTAAAPVLSVLVTSQETIKAADEHVYRLGGLNIPPAGDAQGASRSGAVQLFAARAQAVDPRFQLTENKVQAVIEICQRLDGIPLAIELAAARVPLLGVEGLRTRLHERFNLLTGGARVVLRRHQTLRATLEWSHGLLTTDEQTVLRRLGVFVGGFTLEAAQHVASDDRIDSWTTLDHLGALVDKSLVLAEGNAIPRYRMLETTRAYALERLADAGEMQTTLRRHAEAILSLLQAFEHYDARWRVTGDIEPAAKVELDNVRAALEWTHNATEGALAVALAGVSYSVWWSSSHMAEGLERCLALRSYVDAGVPTDAAARFWLTVADLGIYSTRRESYDAAVRAAALYRQLDHRQRQFGALTFAAVQGTRFATIVQTQAHIDEAARLEQPEWPARQRAKLQFARCYWLARQGRLDEALASAQRQVDICSDAGAEVAALYSMSNVALVESLLGRPLEALEHSREAIARLHAIGADAGAGHLYFPELIALLMLGRTDEAAVSARNGYIRLLHEGDQHRMLLPIALLNALVGRLDIAARIVGFDEALHARTGENISIWAPLLHGRLDPLLTAGLGADERAQLIAQGAGLREDEVFRLAFGDPA